MSTPSFILRPTPALLCGALLAVLFQAGCSQADHRLRELRVPGMTVGINDTGADSDPVPVQDLRHIVRVNAFEGERRHAAFILGGGTENLYPGDFLEALEGVLGDLVLVLGNCVHSQ